MYLISSSNQLMFARVLSWYLKFILEVETANNFQSKIYAPIMWYLFTQLDIKFCIPNSTKFTDQTSLQQNLCSTAENSDLCHLHIDPWEISQKKFFKQYLTYFEIYITLSWHKCINFSSRKLYFLLTDLNFWYLQAMSKLQCTWHTRQVENPIFIPISYSVIKYPSYMTEVIFHSVMSSIFRDFSNFWVQKEAVSTSTIIITYDRIYSSHHLRQNLLHFLQGALDTNSSFTNGTNSIKCLREKVLL